jgi:membrane-bound lytic murein transglycosylase
MTRTELDELQTLTDALGESVIRAIQHSPTVWSDVNSLERRVDERFMKLREWVRSKAEVQEREVYERRAFSSDNI